MVLKKQTVWLLTMLSLIIVLSVYYIFSPDGSPADMAYVDDEEASDEQTAEELSEEERAIEDMLNEEAAEDEAADDESVVSNVASDEMFAALRIDITEARDRQIAEYQEIVASTDVSAEMKSEAFAKMEELNEQAKQIQVLESLLKNQYGYEDVIINPTDDRSYNVIVKADELSNKEANEIMRETAKQLGGGIVTVEYAKR